MTLIENIQRLSVVQRRLVFFLLFGGGLLAIVAVTALLISASFNGQRPQAVSLEKGLTVAQFAALPDKDAYPAAVAVGPDGTVYTGSYATGAVWAIGASGQPRELPGTRAGIGAVAGLAVAPDGAILVVDQADSDPRTLGGDVKRIGPDGKIAVFATIPDARGFLTPDDVELDSAGRVYVTDRGRDQVWRFDADGKGGVAWWTPPAEPDGKHGAVTGLAYDAAHDTLIVTDPDLNVLYRVSIADAKGSVLYRDPADDRTPPGFDGATAAPDGTLYVASLGQNGIVTLRDGQLVYVAGEFRGSSDVAFAKPDKLYVANFDQSSLLLPLIQPRLPFALDVMTLPS